MKQITLFRSTRREMYITTGTLFINLEKTMIKLVRLKEMKYLLPSDKGWSSKCWDQDLEVPIERNSR